VTKPTITQVEGFATGAGCGIVATCDLSVATTDSAIGIPIARTLGNVASSGTFARIVHLIGPARAKELIFTGRLIPAPEAQAIGLINRVVARESIESEVMDIARQIAANAPLTIRATKEMTRRLMDARSPEQGDADLIELCYMSADFKEGVEGVSEQAKAAVDRGLTQLSTNTGTGLRRSLVRMSSSSSSRQRTADRTRFAIARSPGRPTARPGRP
jgi:enoyl-CoA hydratase/carnithine racemase